MSLLSLPSLLLLLATLLLTSFLRDILSHPRLPASIPRVGYPPPSSSSGPPGSRSGGVLSSAWTKIRNGISVFRHHRAWTQQGYTAFNLAGQAFVLPASISRPDDVVLPRGLVKWMVEQPDSVLSAHEAHAQILYSEYNFLLGKNLDRDGFGTRAVHKYLARHLPSLVPAIQDESSRAVASYLGRDTHWRKVNLWQLWLSVVPRVTNRLLVGEPLCHEEEFLGSCVAFVDDVVRNSFLLSMVPRVMHPVVGRLVTLPNRLHWKRLHARVEPVIRERVRGMKGRVDGDARYEDWEPPEDLITWIVRLALLEGNAAELDPRVISRRLLPVEFAAIHTTALTGHSWMLDLLSTPPSSSVLPTLHAELLTHRPPAGQPWTKSSLLSLTRLDSSIRESQRLSNFAATLVERRVVAEEGLTCEALGWTVPRGAFVTVNLEGTHHDEELYPGARGYDPWRYSRARKSDERGLKGKGLGMVTTGDAHLAFGHGRHAW